MKHRNIPNLDTPFSTADQIGDTGDLTLKGIAFDLVRKFTVARCDNSEVYLNLGNGPTTHFVSIFEPPCQQIIRLFAETRGLQVDDDELGTLLEHIYRYGCVRGYSIAPELHDEIPDHDATIEGRNPECPSIPYIYDGECDCWEGPYGNYDFARGRKNGGDY